MRGRKMKKKNKFEENSTVPLRYHTQKTFLAIEWRWFNLDRPTGLCIKKREKGNKLQVASLILFSHSILSKSL